MRSRPVLRRTALAVTLVYLGLAAWWTLVNVGSFPLYGDAYEYIKIASTMRVDGYRGILYPLILSAASHFGPLNYAPPAVALTTVQLLQYVLSVASIGYALHVMLTPRLAAVATLRRHRVLLFLLFLALLELDPLVTHFNLAIMTDGLALGSSLAFCAALADLATGRSPRWLASTILVAAVLVMTGLRVERTVVVTATCLLTWAMWRHGGEKPGVAREGIPRRLSAALLVAVALCAIVQSSRALVTQDLGRWSLFETAVHFRVIYPGMEQIYDRLPDDIRSRLSRQDAEEYDVRTHNVWTVIDRITNKDPAERARVTWTLLWISAKERWPSVLARTLDTFVENLFAPASFYVRTAYWKWTGEGDSLVGHPWVYVCLSRAWPLLSAALVSYGAVMFAAAAVLAALQSRNGITGGFRQIPPDVVPFVAFWLTLNLVLAVTTAGVFARYTLFSHVLVVFVVYFAAIRWLATAPPDPSETR